MISIEEMAEQFKLLGDKTRLKMMFILNEHSLCVCQLVDLLETTQPNVSQHLRKLKHAGLVKEERRGQWIYYSLHLSDQPHLQHALAHLPKLEEKDRQKIKSILCE
ncbi:ArsR/SmtB family transcription factor [Paenibacillus faecalis]|uniref:ArsR/SmtB family transcription factor n=1 Tax=Paenibacillus faecalis TaxID=2079532 RepID=UPI000D0F664F|nr:metalloregulator ArsR/SmtB family transcription factor [Paenibacillus faecalis]